ncbi:MAG: division/cell wall cluster transcriptional repressor MraZ [Ruminococcaceae bacterium]|nr:division/cell wall cluster transcriptional repressor MraZ [Oscillospiraceae bacterium]
MSFVGSYSYSLDAKGRVFIPAKFREDLGSEFYITRKHEPYLSIYTANDWEDFVKSIQDLPESIAAELQDYFLGAAQKCNPDGSGRIILDKKLMSHAKIDKNIVFVGAGKQIKIWAEEVWNEREASRDLERIRDLMRQYNL